MGFVLFSGTWLCDPQHVRARGGLNHSDTQHMTELLRVTSQTRAPFRYDCGYSRFLSVVSSAIKRAVILSAAPVSR